MQNKQTNKKVRENICNHLYDAKHYEIFVPLGRMLFCFALFSMNTLQNRVYGLNFWGISHKFLDQSQRFRHLGYSLFS